MAIITTLSRIRNLTRSLRAVEPGVYRPEEVEFKLARIRQLEAQQAGDADYLDRLRTKSYLQQIPEVR